MLEVIQVKTSQRIEMIDITKEVNQVVSKSSVSEGICCLYVPHTTAAVAINENSDPSVVSDIIHKLNELVPVRDNYSHLEGNSDAHIKSVLFSPSISLIIDNKSLIMGTWQSIYFCEFDGPRTRKLYIKIK
jgi:secondary thiamine-phosphate synthase enzyme